ncbi:btb domain transcription factor [Holotrichia oblita]|uniref:Btb domain transcription factor n=1 Tax=Holotrichia oblita TaxID=644536 RepID=A0ACB9SRT1_HOLOL|nr:btb domain transcription factor [Holotrichia oblita]
MVLSVCSPYFRELFQMNPCKHPIVFMKDVSYVAMRDLLTFMYQGEVQVNQEQLTTFIKTAEALQIKGLTSDGNNEAVEIIDDQPEEIITTKVIPPVHVTQENEIITKPTQKTKKVLSSASTSSYPPVKRQKPSSPTRDKPLTVTLKADTAPSSLTTEQKPPTSEQLLHFKMEPYEADQSDATQVDAYDENPDDTFGEDGMDEGAVDDPDYNTMLKGEDEPQASTSGDALGEGQDMAALKSDNRRKRVTTRMRLVIDGFVYHNNIIAGSPPLRYLGCSELRRSGCRGRATLPVNGDSTQLKLTHPHNHPPDLNAEEKVTFMKELRRLVKQMGKCTLKHVYETVAEFLVVSKRNLVLQISNGCNGDTVQIDLFLITSLEEREIIKLIYYRCANKKSSGCLATAVLAKNASIDTLTILRPHNHPLDKAMEMKYNFEMELTKAVKNSSAPIKNLYDTLAEIHPESAKLVPYDQNLYNRLKRRRSSPYNVFGECCTATAKIDGNATSEHLKVIRPHNHPPDGTIEVKVIFETQLRKAVQNMTNMDNRRVTDFSLSHIILETIVKRPRKKKAEPERIILNGFLYHTSVVRHNPAVRYLVCSKYISAGCRGRAILPINADHSNLRITQPHNHPPDNTVAEKYDFLKRLKLAVQGLPKVQLKMVFDEVVQYHPKISGEYTYESLRSSLRRWRKEAEHINE